MSTMCLGMNQQLVTIFLTAACLASRSAAQPGINETDTPGVGDLHGVARGLKGEPVANAVVLAHSLADKSDRIVVSGSDGSFVVTNL